MTEETKEEIKKQPKESTFKVKSLETEVASLKKTLEKAIQENKDLKSRYDELTTRHADLVKTYAKEMDAANESIKKLQKALDKALKPQKADATKE